MASVAHFCIWRQNKYKSNATKQYFTKQSVDIWAIGTMMYTLLAGHHPIYRKGMSNEEFIERLKAYQITFPDNFSEYSIIQNGKKFLYETMQLQPNLSLYSTRSSAASLD